MSQFEHDSDDQSAAANQLGRELRMAPTYHVPPAEARDLWKQAACAALSGLNLPIRGAGADPMFDHWSKDGAYSAAQTADALVAEYQKRYETGGRPPAMPAPTGVWPDPEPGRVYRVGVDPAAPGGDRAAVTYFPPLPEVRGTWPDASEERLDIIEANECPTFNSLVTKRFRACFNEIRRLTDALRGAESHGK